MLQCVVRVRILDISASSTSDDVLVTSSDVADISVHGDLLFYIDVNISSRNDVTSDVINAQVCFIATDYFGQVLF